MRKLRPAEIRFLKFLADGFKGYQHPYFYPKGTNYKTVQNLYMIDLIKHAFIDFYQCPMMITEAGKKKIKENNNEK